MNPPQTRIIVALDVPDRDAALGAVERLSGHVGCFKVGLELFISEGPSLVRDIRAAGEKVFLDLKLHDIPNTVAAAVRSAARLDVDMLTVHAAGGLNMLQAAREAAAGFANPPTLLAVTALTSLSSADAERLGISHSLEDWVTRLAALAHEAGIRGVVASPLELSAIRECFGHSMLLVAPGVRPSGANAGDQARTAEPGAAVRAGADFIVIGRPILHAADPVAAADRIAMEIERTLATG
jgi:orotidine-5'-phosphate decarboxylase